MAISSLLSIAGNTLAPFAREVVEQATGGLSFEKLLRLGRPTGKDARSAVDFSASQLPASPDASSPTAAQLEAIRRQPPKELEAYVDRLRERLLAAGIDLTKAIPLKVGLGGEIQVDGDHPDRAAIEDLLATDSQLAATFRMLANTLTKQFDATSGEPFSSEFRLTVEASEFKVSTL